MARIVAIALIVGVAATAGAGVDGLVLNGEATRSRLFIDLYSVALYLPQRTTDPAAVLDPRIPKVLEVEIHYPTPGEPDREDIPEDWRDELLPLLTEEQVQYLKTQYARLQSGDIVRAQYRPETGTTIAVNDKPVLEGAGHDLMEAVLGRLIGPDPVDEELRASVLGKD